MLFKKKHKKQNKQSIIFEAVHYGYGFRLGPPIHLVHYLQRKSSGLNARDLEKWSAVVRLVRTQFRKPFGLDSYVNLFAFYAVGVRRSGPVEFNFIIIIFLPWKICYSPSVVNVWVKETGWFHTGLFLFFFFFFPYVLYERHSVQPPTSIHPPIIQ